LLFVFPFAAFLHLAEWHLVSVVHPPSTFDLPEVVAAAVAAGFDSYFDFVALLHYRVCRRYLNLNPGNQGFHPYRYPVAHWDFHQLPVDPSDHRYQNPDLYNQVYHPDRYPGFRLVDLAHSAVPFHQEFHPHRNPAVFDLAAVADLYLVDLCPGLYFDLAAVVAKASFGQQSDCNDFDRPTDYFSRHFYRPQYFQDIFDSQNNCSLNCEIPWPGSQVIAPYQPTY